MIEIAIPYIFHDDDWQGGRNYFANLIRAVRLVAGDRVNLTLVTGQKTRTTLKDEFVDLKVLRTSLLDRKSFGWWLRTIDLHLFDNDRLFALYLRHQRIDVLTHCMHLGPRPGLVTLSWLYDFQFMHLPELWSKRQLKWSAQWYRAACRNCDGLLVSSVSALNDLNNFHPSGTSIRGALKFVSNPISLSTLPPLSELQGIYRIKAKYIFLPNQFWQNKNHELVVQALSILKSSSLTDVQVVCTGNPLDHRQPDYFGKLMGMVSTHNLEENFRVLGIVPLKHAQALMYHSLAVLNPSRFEGWSTSVEEAKTMDKTILLSSIPVHLEQDPPRGVFFDPDNANQLAQIISSQYMNVTSCAEPKYRLESYEDRLRVYGDAYIALLEEVLKDKTSHLPRSS